MTYLRVSQAPALLGVSDDTVRRYISLGRLPVRRDEANRRVIDGAALAAFARRRVPLLLCQAATVIAASGAERAASASNAR